MLFRSSVLQLVSYEFFMIYYIIIRVEKNFHNQSIREAKRQWNYGKNDFITSFENSKFVLLLRKLITEHCLKAGIANDPTSRGGTGG